jgi:RNA polymerase sigma factor (sigma-70 family)
MQIRLGNESTRQAFVEAWLPIVAEEARRYAARGGSAEELRAEGALALWEAVLGYGPQRHRTTPERYIGNQIHRRVRRLYREQMGFGRPGALPLALAAPVGAPDRQFSAAEQRADLAAAIGSLEPVEQAHLTRYLRLVELGAGPDEAARQLARGGGGSYAAWKKRIARVRRKLKKRLTAM